MERIEADKGLPARIFTFSKDGAIGLFSPYNADKIITGLPLLKDIEVISAIFDRHAGALFNISNCIYVLLKWRYFYI